MGECIQLYAVDEIVTLVINALGKIVSIMQIVSALLLTCVDLVKQQSSCFEGLLRLEP
jgi:hypothetical protein